MKQFYHQPSYSTVTVPYDYAPSNEQAAWFAIVYTAACINGEISVDARETFCKLIASKELFRGHELLDYFYEFREVKDNLEPKEIIHQAAKLVNPEQAPTLFCIVAETLLAKGYLTEQEDDLLDFIGERLSLDKAVTSKIMEVLLLKNAGNCIYN
jgi:hypothetical protein